jgi:hypothetical protein
LGSRALTLPSLLFVRLFILFYFFMSSFFFGNTRSKLEKLVCPCRLAAAEEGEKKSWKSLPTLQTNNDVLFPTDIAVAGVSACIHVRG